MKCESQTTPEEDADIEAARFAKDFKEGLDKLPPTKTTKEQEAFR